MGKSKVEQFVNKELDSFITETREYKSFTLGYAYGYYQLYKHIETELGTDETRKCFAPSLSGTDLVSLYFKKIVDLDEIPTTKADELYTKLKNML